MCRALLKSNRNERGERLQDFAEENNHVITNSFFQKAANRYGGGKPQGVWPKPKWFHKSSDRKTIGNCEVITKVEIGSDHRMIRARVEIKKKLTSWVPKIVIAFSPILPNDFWPWRVIINKKLLRPDYCKNVYRTHTILRGKWTLFPLMIVLSLFSTVRSCE